MATLALVPVSEYLRSFYEPDAEYVDGHIEQRSLGELDHSDLQGRLLSVFGRKEALRYFRANAGYRVQVAATRFRVPDVALRRLGLPREQVATTPPLLCIEVLSPEDTMQKTLVRVQDFLTMGVPQVWVIDSASRSVHVYDGKRTVEQFEGDLLVPETPVAVSIAEVFSVLDEG